ncbi:hypothetical protein V8F20_000574 [Naviculisporaceae sp. PSN 640]
MPLSLLEYAFESSVICFRVFLICLFLFRNGVVGTRGAPIAWIIYYKETYSSELPPRFYSKTCQHTRGVSHIAKHQYDFRGPYFGSADTSSYH